MRTIKHIGESQFARRYREVGELTIYFKSKDEVYVTDGKTSALFERWWDGRFVYKDKWKPFCHELTRKNTLETVWDIYKLANKYGVIGHTVGSFPEISADARVLPSRYSSPRKEKK